MKNAIPVCELSEENAYPLFCPFCGTRVQDFDSNGELQIDPCPHTLFVCHDMGWDHVSDRMHAELKGMGLEASHDEAEAVTPLSGDKDDFEGPSFDEVTSSVKLPESLKFAIYQGPPSFYGTYVGFCPNE